MPTYDYYCADCDGTTEIMHMMSDTSPRPCPECGKDMVKQLGMGYFASKGFNPTAETHREREHQKKVKDFERAVRNRKKHFGKEAVGDPNDRADPKHIIKRGRTLGGQQKEIDKKDLAKALAKDDYSVRTAQEALKKARKK